ncbi:MAG: amino acid adenylation domain-containing protein, partial [Acidobacteriota bacterium]
MSDESNTALQTRTFDPFAGPALLLTAPATGPQREIWTATRVSDDASRAFNESVSLRLVGPVDLDALMRAGIALIQRHESLRSTFTPDGMTLCVAESIEPVIPFVDCRFMSEADRESTWLETLNRAVDETFDLEEGPLVRIVIVRFAAQEYRVCLTAHHIVCDGWSTAILVKDWAHLYSAAVKASDSALPPPAAFSAYALEELEHEQTAQHIDDENYWVSQFSDDVPVLDLPTDRPRPALKTYHSRREDLVLDAGLVARLKQAAAKQRASLFVMLLAGFQTLVHRLSSQDDLVVGIPVAGQSAGGHADLVGHCVHLLPIRVQMTGRTPFRELLATMRGRVLDAVEHQAFTFSRLLERLPLRRDPSRLPLVSVIFNLDKGIGPDQLDFNGLEPSLSTNPRRFENFELFLNAVELDGRVTLECQYNTDLFDAATIRGWLGSYRQLLVSAAAGADQEIGALNILPDDDRRLLEAWNGTAAPCPPVCVHDLIEAQAQRTPDGVALEFEGSCITYREMNDRAERLANRLRTAGVQQDVLVGLCVDRSIGMVVSVLAVLKAGGGYVPLDPGYPLDRLNFMVSDSRMSVLVTTRALRETVPLSAAHVLALEDVDADEPSAERTDLGAATPESVAYVIYTSGSTGRPKGVMVPHRAVVNLLTSVRQLPGMTASDVVLAITTLSFDIAVSEILLPLTVGARVVIASRETASDGDALLKLMRGAGITFVDATPSTWRLLIDAGWQGGERLTAICTGEAMPRDLAIELVTRAGTVWNGYGPTETTVWSSFQQVTAPVERILIGRPVANTQMHVLDERLQPVPIGARGELYIGGAGVTLGYLHRPDLTGERFVRVPVGTTETTLYRTGDIARYLRTGDLECLGRNDDQVKLRGFRIELGEIEDALAKHEALARVAVIAREDRPGDKRLVGYIVLRPGASVTDGALKACLQQSLPGHMIPGVFVRLATLPLTPSGKVNRRNLPAPEIGAVVSDQPFVAPRTATETIVAEL